MPPSADASWLRRAGASVARGAIDVLLPPRCLACENPVDRPGLLCAECFPRYRFITAPMCARCGIPFAHPGEAGAGGIMAAMVKGAAEAEELMAWSKFHPRGRRGINGSGVDGRYGSDNLAEYMARANAETVVGVQIERVEALEEVERIAAVPGLDFLFVGPADLSQSLGIPGQWDHPRLAAARG